MEENRYSTAGWLSVAAAVLLPLAFIVDGLTELAVEFGDIDIPWGVGPGDALFLLYAGLLVYVLKSFKSLMYEYYSFREIGIVINMAIFWTIIFFVGSFIIELALTTVWPPDDLGLPVVLLVFWIVGLVVFGIIDILLGIIILRHRNRFSTSITVFAGLSLAIGFFEGTVVLSFLTLLLGPASFVVLAYIFLRKPEEVEFV